MWDGRDKDLGDAPRYARGAESRDSTKAKFPDNFFFLDLRGVFVLVCAYQLRVRSLLGIEARRINCLEATTIALYPSPTHIVPSNAVCVFVKSQQSNRLTSSGHPRSTAVLAYGLLPQLPSVLVVLHLLMSPQQRSLVSKSLLHCHLVRNDTPSQLPDLHPQPSIDRQLQLRLRQSPTQFEIFDSVMVQVNANF
jgi:hypothetical protein